MCACEIKRLHNVSVLSVNLVWRGWAGARKILLFLNCMSRFMITVMKKKRLYSLLGHKGTFTCPSPKKSLKKNALSQYDGNKETTTCELCKFHI